MIQPVFLDSFQNIEGVHLRILISFYLVFDSCGFFFCVVLCYLGDLVIKLWALKSPSPLLLHMGLWWDPQVSTRPGCKLKLDLTQLNGHRCAWQCWVCAVKRATCCICLSSKTSISPSSRQKQSFHTMENSRDSTPSCSPTIDALVIYVLLMWVPLCIQMPE